LRIAWTTLVEFIAALDDRLKEAENLLTHLATGDVRPEAD
jgi:hypothetical protein